LVFIGVVMKTKRSYTMTARAEAVEATRQQILQALIDLSGQRLFADIGLDTVAERAGVSVQTVLRHFGNRAGLFEAAVELGRSQVAEERRVPAGDVAEAMRVLVDHYEARGHGALLMLAQEQSEEVAASVTAHGKALHYDWVEEAFGPLLPASGKARAAAIDLLVVACDVYAWKILRLDRGLSRAQTQARMEQLVRAVLTGLGASTGGRNS
jgi:AcrR family transcriptional regulator